MPLNYKAEADAAAANLRAAGYWVRRDSLPDAELVFVAHREVADWDRRVAEESLKVEDFVAVFMLEATGIECLLGDQAGEHETKSALIEIASSHLAN